jgi:hypothetical protein
MFLEIRTSIEKPQSTGILLYLLPAHHTNKSGRSSETCRDWKSRGHISALSGKRFGRGTADKKELAVHSIANTACAIAVRLNIVLTAIPSSSLIGRNDFARWRARIESVRCIKNGFKTISSIPSVSNSEFIPDVIAFICEILADASTRHWVASGFVFVIRAKGTISKSR